MSLRTELGQTAETVPVHPGEETVTNEQPPSRRPAREARALSGTFPGNLPRLCWPRRTCLYHLTASRELRSRSALKEETLQGFGWLRGEGPGPRPGMPVPLRLPSEKEVPVRPTPEPTTSPCPAAAAPGQGRRGINVALQGSLPFRPGLIDAGGAFPSFLPIAAGCCHALNIHGLTFQSQSFLKVERTR